MTGEGHAKPSWRDIKAWIRWVTSNHIGPLIPEDRRHWEREAVAGIIEIARRGEQALSPVLSDFEEGFIFWTRFDAEDKTAPSGKARLSRDVKRFASFLRGNGDASTANPVTGILAECSARRLSVGDTDAAVWFAMCAAARPRDDAHREIKNARSASAESERIRYRDSLEQCQGELEQCRRDLALVEKQLADATTPQARGHKAYQETHAQIRKTAMDCLSTYLETHPGAPLKDGYAHVMETLEKSGAPVSESSLKGWRNRGQS
jgi:hypothetical protein